MKARIITAAVLALIAWAGTSWLLDLPPFDSPEEYTLPVVVQAEAKAFPQKAPFRFGSRALAGICDEFRLDQDSLINEMKSFGINAKPEWAIKRIAEENDMEVAAVFEMMRQLAETAD